MADVLGGERVPRVMHLVDSLSLGGAERVAVNLANLLRHEGCEVHLCTTRQSGPLETAVDTTVHRLRLQRARRLDVAAIHALAQYVRHHDIDILHAHGTAVFGAAAAAWYAGRGRVIWHVHYGAFASEARSGFPYRLVRSRIAHTITASIPLSRWVGERIGFDSRSVSYVPNFILPPAPVEQVTELPGERGARVVCVANFTEAKDHGNLVDAMQAVVRRVPRAHLLLVGGEGDGRVAESVRRSVAERGLGGSVSFLGQRTDVPTILAACDVGVISSVAEGLPLALLEYGQAGLAAVTTDVGQCADVVDHGAAGIVVPSRNPHALGDAIVRLLETRTARVRCGAALQERVQESFSPATAVRAIMGVYRDLIG